MTRLLLTVLTAALVAPCLVGCGDGDSSGGEWITAGGAGSGGAEPVGGAPSSGGATSTGGAGPSGGATASGGASPRPPFEEAWRECTAPEDCVFIAVESCCGCSLLGVHESFEADARASIVPVDLSACGPVGCASPPCPLDPIPGCEEGQCVALPGCSERPLDGCEADALCQAFSARLCTSPATPFAPLACAPPPDAAGCDDVETCRVNPGNGLMLLFPDGCVPPGWTQECPVACD